MGVIIAWRNAQLTLLGEYSELSRHSHFWAFHLPCCFTLIYLTHFCFANKPTTGAVWFYILIKFVDQQNTQRMWAKLIWGLVRFPARSPPDEWWTGRWTQYLFCHKALLHCTLCIVTLLHCYIVHCNTLLHHFYSDTSKHCTMLWCYIVPYDCLSELCHAPHNW